MILMNDFKAEPLELQTQELAAAERVLKSGWYILGEEGKKFEHEWALFCGAKHAVGVGNGMDAIEIGLRALNIGPGDEVITTPMTAMATVLAIARVGATPVLADINSETALLDPAAVEKRLTSKTKAVLLVHLYGQICDMEKWKSLCDARGIHLLEDCAQSHGAIWNEKKAGTFGIFGAFSFYPTKNLGAKGDGGALVTDSEEIATRARTIRNYGQSKRYEHPQLGLNSRLDEMQAAILSVRLQWLARFNQRRRQIAEAYFAGIENSKLRFLSQPMQSENHVYHLFVLRCVERERLAMFLKERGMETLIHYPMPAHLQLSFRFWRESNAAFLRAEQHAAECLSIPCHPQMSDGQVQQVIESLNAFC